MTVASTVLAAPSDLTPPAVVMAALRDDAPRPTAGQTPLAVASALMVSLLGSALFGVALGGFGGSAAQMLASALKAPMLLLGTTALCFPAFYVMQLTRAPRPLALGEALHTKAHALAATALWWGALALPLSFLASTVQHYRLAQGLALLVGAAGGIVGLRRFWVQLVARVGPAPRGTMLAYFVLYGAVGAQLSWFLRPFLGAPDQPFELLRGLRGNFFGFVLGPLLGG
ncbi:MAG: hypothetical protein KDK70_26970 [Myxococcales bacterium]|nr:hypothetical protein [Myxococcales bacterium]